MRHLLTAFFILLFSFYSFAQNEVIIAGEIKNPMDFITNITLQDASLQPQMRFYGGLMDEKNQFKVNFKLDEPVEAILRHKMFETKIYLEPGDSIFISSNTDEFIKFLSFSGTPSAAAHNNFLHQYEIDFGETSGSTPIPVIKNLLPTPYQKYTKTLRKKKLKYFKKHSLAKQFTKSFKHYFSAEVDYAYAEDLVEYPRLNPILNDKRATLDVPSKYFKFLKKIDINNPLALNSANYRSFLNIYTSYILRKNTDKSLLKNENFVYKEKIKIIKATYQGKVMHYAFTKILMDAAKRNRMNALAGEIDDFFSMDDTPNEYRILVSDTYKVVRGLRPGSKAPNFNLESADGEMVTLEDLKGKVIYLDFWATWCGPCLKEIEPARKLKTTFKDKDVVFLYITLDTNKGRWKKFIQDRDMVGLHLFATGSFNTEVAKKYNITGVPSYFIIDKEGIISTSSAKRPSQLGVVQEIEAVLRKDGGM